MSTVSMKKRYPSVLEKIIKNAVSETSKVLETVIAELKAEVLTVRSENENLKIRCCQFEEVVKRRSVYRETGTSPDPWIIEKCDKAVQCDFILHHSNDDPNLSDNETQSESSFGPTYEKESSNDSFSFSQTKDFDGNSCNPLDLSNATTPEQHVVDYEAMLVDTSCLDPQLSNMESIILEAPTHSIEQENVPTVLVPHNEHHEESDTSYQPSEMEIQEDICTESVKTNQSLLEGQEAGLNELNEEENLPLQEEICVSTDTKDIIHKKTKECESSPLIALSTESERFSNALQEATEETIDEDTEIDKQSTLSSELKSGDSSTTDTKNDNNFEQVDASTGVCNPPDHAGTLSEDIKTNVPTESKQTRTEIDDTAVQSISSENIHAKEVHNTSQAVLPPKSQYFLRRQRCTSVTLEDAMLLLDAVSQQKYKSSPPKKPQTKDSSKNVATLKLFNIPEVTPQSPNNSEEATSSAESLQPHTTHGTITIETLEDDVCPTNMSIERQENNSPSNTYQLIDHGVHMSTPIKQKKSTQVKEADSAGLKIEDQHDHQKIICRSTESSPTLVTENITLPTDMDETMQTADTNTANMDIEEHDKTAASPTISSLSQPKSDATVPLVAQTRQNKKTSKQDRLLEMEQIVFSDKCTIDNLQLDPKSFSDTQPVTSSSIQLEEGDHTEYLCTTTENCKTTQVAPDHPTLTDNKVMEIDLTPAIDLLPSKLLQQTASDPKLLTPTETTEIVAHISDHPTHDSSEFQENDQTVTVSSPPIPSSALNPPIQHTMLIKLPGDACEQSSSVVKTITSASTLSPAQLSAVVSAVRSTQSRSSPTSPSIGTPSGKKALVAVPFSLQSVMRPHHKIIVIPRQCKVASSQAISKDNVIVLKQKASATEATTTFISTTDVNLETTSGEGSSGNSLDQQHTSSVTSTTQSFLDTSPEITEPSSTPVKSPCKNTVQIKLNRIPFPLSSAESVSVTDMPVNAFPVSSAQSASVTDTPINETPKIIVRKKRGRPPLKKNIVAIDSSQPQAQIKEDNLPSPITGSSTMLSAKEASLNQSPTPINQSFSTANQPHIPASQSPTLENHTPTLENQSPSPVNQTPTPVNQIPTPINWLSSATNQSTTPANQSLASINQSLASINQSPTSTNQSPSSVNQPPSPENLTPSPEQLIPVVAGDHSYPQHRMTKSQFLAKLEVSPVTPSSKKADAIEKDAQKASLVDRLRSHLKPHIKTIRKAQDGANLKEEVKEPDSDTTQETFGPNQDQQSENLPLPDPVRHNDENKTVTPKTSPAPKNVSNKSQVQRKRSPKRNLKPTKTAKRPKLKKEGASNENISSGRKLSPMRNKIINSNALLSCVRKGIKKKSFLCKFCRKEFGKKKDIEVHIQVHVGKKPFQCNICHRRFSRTMELSRHLKRHNAEKKYQCTSCGKAFIEYNNLKRHTYIHTGEKPYSCPHCPSAFTQSGHMKTHIRNKHKDMED